MFLRFAFTRSGFSIGAAAALLAGCGAPLPTAMPQDMISRIAAATVQRDRTPSWMAPRVKAQHLLYVTSAGTGSVSVYTYPAGKPSGKLTGFIKPMGDCVDQAGHIWIVDWDAISIAEFAHGGTKRLATLKNSQARSLLGCSVDPTTGDLAVTEVGPASGGAIWIYANAKGTPKKYAPGFLKSPYFLAYDGAGNLFADGLDNNYAFAFGELPSGSSSFKSIALNQNVTFPGGVQWDGTNVAVGDQFYQNHHQSAIYQVTVSGSTGSVVGTTPLNGTCDVAQFGLSGSSVIAPDDCLNNAGFYSYPGGGTPTNTLTGFQYPIGAIVSNAPHH